MIGGRLCDYGAISNPSSGTQRFQLPAFGPNPGPDFSLSGFCGASGQVGYLCGSVGTEGEPTRSGLRKVRDRTPSDPEHKVVLARAQREQDGPEQDGPIIPAIDVTI